jgi:hypothetical protein
VSEKVGKAHVESLSHKEYSQAEDAIDKVWAMRLGRMTENLMN